MPFYDSIGDEHEGGRKIGKQLLNSPEPLKVGLVTTDGDGRSAAGIQEVMLTANVETEHCLDPGHLFRGVRRAVSKLKMSDYFVEAESSREKNRKQTRLGDDLTYRVSSEYNAAIAVSANHEDLQSRLANAILAILDCYEGKHRKCARYSHVCGKQLYTFPYLHSDGGKLTFTANDRSLLNQILTEKLGRHAVDKMKYGRNTQKAEAANHGYSFVNCKSHTTYARNAKNRDHAAILTMNNGPGLSIAKKTAALGTPISKHSPASRALNVMQARKGYQSTYARSPQAKKSRSKQRTTRFQMHARLKTSAKSEYKKDQLNPVLVVDD